MFGQITQKFIIIGYYYKYYHYLICLHSESVRHYNSNLYNIFDSRFVLIKKTDKKYYNIIILGCIYTKIFKDQANQIDPESFFNDSNKKIQNIFH